MTKTFESISDYSAKYDADREVFLDNNDRGFEVPVNEEAKRIIAQRAFEAITNQIESDHNID